MSPTLHGALPAAHRHGLWVPYQTTTLTLEMPSGEQYAFQVWRDPIRHLVSDHVLCTNAPEPHWIHKQVQAERGWGR
jgi:hypothetical protein